MPHVLNLDGNPVLGCLHPINRKHRLRSKHFMPVVFPEDLSIDVLDPQALDSLDHFPCLDRVFLVSQKLKDVIQNLSADVEIQPVNAGGKKVFLVMPCDQIGIGFECQESRYSANGYQVVSATELKVTEVSPSLFSSVRGTGFLSISEELVAAAAKAGVNWELAEVISTYEPMRQHPYSIFGTSNAAAMIKHVIATSDWPEAQSPGHPLGANAVDEGLRGGADEGWATLVADTDYASKCLTARFASGLPIPELRGELDEKASKSSLKKRWKETTAAKTASVAELPIISRDIREIFEAAGVEADYQPFSIADTALDAKREDMWIVHPRHVVPWIDWSKSDVGLLWSGMMQEYFALYPTEESYTSTLPVVRVEGSTFVLVRNDLAESLTKGAGFKMIPLHERASSQNLDDRFKH